MCLLPCELCDVVRSMYLRAVVRSSMYTSTYCYSLSVVCKLDLHIYCTDSSVRNVPEQCSRPHCSERSCDLGRSAKNPGAPKKSRCTTVGHYMTRTRPSSENPIDFGYGNYGVQGLNPIREKEKKPKTHKKENTQNVNTRIAWRWWQG